MIYFGLCSSLTVYIICLARIKFRAVVYFTIQIAELCPALQCPNLVLMCSVERTGTSLSASSITVRISHLILSCYWDLKGSLMTAQA